MKTIIKLIPIVLLWAFVITGCNNKKETSAIKKLEQVFVGSNIQDAELRDKYCWNGERLNKIEAYENGNLACWIEFDYLSGSNTKIAELRLLFPYNSKLHSSNFLIDGLKTIATFRKEKEDDFVLSAKMVPVYVNDKVARLDIYSDFEFLYRELSLIGYIIIEYDGDYPNKLSMRIKTSIFPPDYEIPEGVEEIEFFQKYFIWQNGNIITEYNKYIIVPDIPLDRNLSDLKTGDSTIYTYDDKLNAYSSIKNIIPVFGAEISSTNNITFFEKHEFLGSAQMTTIREVTTNYQYDTDNYPTIATTTDPLVNAKVVKYGYKSN
ncbi:MAG TPA: hypothetical protein PLY32_00790 [Salinivirgaceae bacterium]|nr:hypothetical protein [Salinivirgaceae bacterium]HQA75633.1 hypothetical protein [Salinivirgaceae bacterium]